MSPKACQGILRRAARRGKELPEVLRVALGAAGFCYESGEASRGIGYQEEESPTLRCWKPPGRRRARAAADADNTLGLRWRRQGRAYSARPVGDAGLPQRPDAVRAESLRHRLRGEQRNALPQTRRAGFTKPRPAGRSTGAAATPAAIRGGMVVVSPAYSIRPMVNTQTQQEQTPSLMARDSKDPLLVSLPSYCLDRAPASHPVRTLSTA